MNGNTDSCVRKMVRRVIRNMEDFQQNLDSMVQDIQCLIHDIDTVTTEIQERIVRKSTKRCNHHRDAECPLREDALQKLLENVRTVDESPDLDLSYLQITSSYQRPKWGRSLSFPVSSFKLSSMVSPKEEFREEHNATSIVSDIDHTIERSIPDTRVRTAYCTAQLKETAKITTIPRFKSSFSTIDRHSSDSNSSGTYKEINSIQRSVSGFKNTSNGFVEATTQTSFTYESSSEDVNGDVFINDTAVPLYTGSYEREMELELENLIESYKQTRDIDLDDWVMETGNSTRITSTDDEADLDQELNTWMSFTLPNTAPPSESTDSSFSASESDIVNHNTHATAVYGTLIFSDNLVISPSSSRKVVQRFEV